MYQSSTILGIPLNYSLLSSSLCIAWFETSLAFHLHPEKGTKNFWGWSTMSWMGGGQNFMTSMSRSSQDNFHGKNSWKSIKYSQSYDLVCQFALLGGKFKSIGNNFTFKALLISWLYFKACLIFHRHFLVYFLFNIIGMSLKQIMTPSLAARRRTLERVCKEC